MGKVEASAAYPSALFRLFHQARVAGKHQTGGLPQFEIRRKDISHFTDH
jgi:hypothetical protein